MIKRTFEMKNILKVVLLTIIFCALLLYGTVRWSNEKNYIANGNLMIAYDYYGDELTKLVACSNEGVTSADWQETYIVEGERKKCTLSLYEMNKLTGYFLEARAEDEKFFGKMYINKILFELQGCDEIFLLEGAELQKVFSEGNSNIKFENDAIVWEISEEKSRLYFNNEEIQNISNYIEDEGINVINKLALKKTCMTVICILLIMSAILRGFTKKGKNVKNEFILLGISFIILFGYAIVNGTYYFEYDADYYWYLSDKIVQDGSITIYAYPDSYRGYFWPLSLGIAKHIGKLFFGRSIWGMYILQSMSVSILITKVVPRFFESVISIRRQFVATIILLGLIIFFWSSYLVYPLTDIYTFTLYASAIAMLLEKYRKNKICSFKQKKIFLHIVGIGGILAAAYNCRTVYMIPGFVLIFIYIGINVVKRKKIKEKVNEVSSILVGVMLGVILVSIPQCMINYMHHERITPKVLTEYTFGNDLSVVQLYAGITCDRYETLAQESKEYIEDGMSVLYFEDTIGKSILTGEEKSILGYIKLVLKQPHIFCGIYVRHIINGLTPLFRQVYISDSNVKYSIPLLINLIIISATYLISVTKKMKWSNEFLLKLTVIIPAIIAIPGQIEVRFLLPLSIMLYAYIGYGGDLRIIKEKIIEKKKAVILGWIVLMMIWIYIILSTFAVLGIKM